MLRSLMVIVTGIFFGVTGCAIHPLPEDYSGYRTAAIVQQIRCETRESLFKKLEVWIQWVETKGYDPTRTYVIRKPDGTLDPKTLDRLSPSARWYVDYFTVTAVAYSFTFDMTENNNVSAQLDLLRAISHGTVTATTKIGSDRSRQNVRAFTATDTFGKLVEGMKDSYCRDIRAGENYAYPITGTIGIDEMVDNFVDLALFGGLAGSEKQPKDLASADSLEFVENLWECHSKTAAGQCQERHYWLYWSRGCCAY